MKPLTKRHRKFLLRFRRNRERWESPTEICDILRLRQIEMVYVSMVILFCFGTNHWLKSLLSPSISWDTAYGILVSIFVIYMIREIYWAHRSVNYMIDLRAKDISELDITNVEEK